MITDLTFDDYLELCELKSSYFRAVDSQNWGQLHNVFTADAEFRGYGFGIRSGSESLITTLGSVLEAVRSQHSGFNPVFRAHPYEPGTKPERVHALWTFRDELRWPLSYSRLNAPDVSAQIGISGGGYYEDTMERTSSGWRITHTRNTRSFLDAVTSTARVPLDIPPPELSERWL